MDLQFFRWIPSFVVDMQFVFFYYGPTIDLKSDGKKMVLFCERKAKYCTSATKSYEKLCVHPKNANPLKEVTRLGVKR